MSRHIPLALLMLLALAACGEEPAAPAPAQTPADTAPGAPGFPQVAAVRETDPVDTPEDAADDPAIWVDAKDPSRSVIVGTAKKSGLFVYGLDGKQLQFLPEGRINNIDLRAVRLGGGMDKTVLLAASDRDAKAIAFYRLDPETRQLSRLGQRQPSGFADPYGLCLYHSLATDRLYVFMTDKEKGGAQWRVDGAGDGIAVTKVRDLPLASQSEGCVADDLNGMVYVAEEGKGIWAFAAEPEQPAEAKPVAMLADNPRLAADLEGLAIYRNETGQSYLIASSQGNDSFAVFDLGGAYTYRGSFAIGPGSVDGVSETDGIEVTSVALGADFPSGLLVVQDGVNTDPPANQNFKLVSWKAVARALGLK
jgi:3-phytase